MHLHTEFAVHFCQVIVLVTCSRRIKQFHPETATGIRNGFDFCARATQQDGTQTPALGTRPECRPDDFLFFLKRTQTWNPSLTT
jgi:hypothetical protein